MIIHEISFPGFFFIFVMFLGTTGGLLASAVLLLANRLRLAGRVLLTTAAVHSVYLTILVVGYIVSHQTIVKIGDSYCFDSWCLGVTHVVATPGVQDVVYKVDVHIFSDAGRGKQKAPSIPILIDDRGRRFPLIHDPSVIPFDRELDPREGVDTTLTFAVPPDAQKLFLDSRVPRRLPFVLKALTGFWLVEVAERHVPKPILLRVL